MTTSPFELIDYPTSPEYPKYWLRIEVKGAPWHRVRSDVYLAAENRWTRSRDAADHSTFYGNGVEGRVEWFAPKVREVIEGVY